MADEELEGLGRVLTRLALTEDDKLEQVLSRLLPIVIRKLGPGASPVVQKKVLEILSHANKRTRALPALRLPLHELAELYAAPETGVMARNFAVVYLEQAVARAPPAERFAELAVLLTGVSTRPQQHQEMLLRMAAQCLEDMASPGNTGSEQQFAAAYPFLQRAEAGADGADSTAGSASAAADRTLLLQFAQRVLLYQPATSKGPANPLAAAQAAQAAAAGGAQPMDVDAAVPPPPPGLSRQDVAAVEGKQAPGAEALLRQKLGLLNFSAAAGMDPTELLPVYLAAACDPSEQVSRRGDELLKKRCGVDSQRPPVDLEDGAVVERLFDLFHGSLEDEGLAAEARRAPAGPALRARLLALFCRSIAAANCFPHSLATVTVCLYGGGTTPRLRQAGMEFCVWIFKHAAPAQLAPAAASILDGCLTLLDDGSTRGGDVTALSLRGFTYQAIGQLAQRQPQAFAGRTDIAARFFAALSTEPAGVRAAVQEATSSLASAFRGAEGGTAAALQQLLADSVQQAQPEAVRMAALQWAIKLFPFGHVPARHLCILAAADPRFQISEAALEGLQPGKFAARPGAGSAGAALPAYPAFTEVLGYLQQQVPQLARRPPDGASLALPAKAFLAAISFLEACRRQASACDGGGHLHSPGGQGPAGRYLALLENALLLTAPSELHAAALSATLAVAAVQPGAFAAAYAGDAARQQLLLRLLGHTDAGARQAAAQLLGLLVSRLGPGPQLDGIVGTLLSTLRAGSAGGAKHAKQEELEGAAAAAGYVAAHLAQGTPVPDERLPTLLQQLATHLTEGSPLVPEQQLLALLQQLRRLLDDPSSAAPAAATTTAGTSSLRAAAAMALSVASLPLAGAGSELVLRALPDAAGVAAATAELLQDKDPKVVKKAAAALGYLCYGHANAAAAAAGAAGAGDGTAAASGSNGVLQPAVAALLAQRASKSEDVLFSVGEALCFCFGGVGPSAADILHTPFTSLADWRQQRELLAQQAQQQAEGQGAMEVEGGAPADGSSSSAATSSPAQAAAQQQILDALLEECLISTRAEVRCAGAVWLVSLLLHCGRHPRLAPLLPEAQQALSQLLGDQNELTQEMASHGLAAVYDMADAATRQALLDSLMATLSGAPQKRRAVKLADDSKLFEEGQLGGAPAGGGGLSTYKEICSLATELGQPDLVYRFMELANHQAALNSSRGAAFGFASIAKLAGQQLGPHIQRIIPRLYRYLHDPNAKVRDAMSHIWHALLDDPKAALAQNFDAIMKALLADMGAGQWRVREASSLAMADLLQGRRWEELQPHFGALWGMTLRVMDDIKESVRQAGVALARSVRGLTLRLADAELTPAAQGRQAIAVALPLLLETGLPSQVAEVRGLAVDTTCKLAAAAGPALLRPHMPALVPAMLEGLSGLEDVRLNYLEQHAERIGLDAERLEGARVAASQGGPIGETLDLCARYADAATMAELAPRLGALVRRGVGLNTRAGAGRFITQVTRRLGKEMQPLAGQLIKALVEACRADRSPAVRRSFASAAAQLCRCAPSARVNRYVADALASLGAEGADRDDRYVAGLLLRALGREAADVVAAHASEVAPPAFMAQFDDDADVAAVWKEVWEESTASSGAGLRLHMGEVVQLITAGLQSGQWVRKKAAAAALAHACQAAGGEALAPHLAGVLDALLKELPGRIWDGKEAVLQAAGALCTACAAALAPLQRRRLVAALLDAASKKRAAYRKEALAQLEAVLVAFGGGSTSGGSSNGSTSEGGQAEDSGDYYAEVAPLLLELAGSYVEAARGGASMDTDQAQQAQQAQQEGDAEPHPGKAVPVAQVAAVLGAAFATATPATARQHADAAAASLAAVLGAAGKPGDQLAAVAAGCRLAEHAAAVAAQPGQQAAGGVLQPQQPGVAALLQAALALAEDGKAAQLREQSYRLSGLLLEQLWGALPGEERAAVLARLATAEGREKLPAVKSLAAGLAAKLRELGA